MRNLFVISAVCLMVSSAWAAKMTVAIDGMTCQMCVKSITGELNATQKVQNVQVNLDKKNATFETIGAAQISDTEIKDAIKRAGYEARTITRN